MEMVPSDSRLYTAGLSQAALKILAALHSQSLRARRNQNYSSYNRQMEWFDSSQRATWREECMDWSFLSVLHQNSSETQSSQPSQVSLSSHGDYTSSLRQDSSFQTQTSQVKDHNWCTQESSEHISLEELSKAESSQHKVRAALCIQIPQRLLAYQASPWANSSAEIKPSFILSVSPGEDGPNEMLFPTAEQLNSEKNEPQVSSCRTPPDKTDYVFPEYKRKTSGNMDSGRNEEDDVVSHCVSLKNLYSSTEEGTSMIEANTHEERHLHPAQKDGLVNQSPDSKVRNTGTKVENILENKDIRDTLQTTIQIQATEGHSRSPKKMTLFNANSSPQMTQTVTGSDPLLLSESAALVHEDDGQGLDARLGNKMETGDGSSCFSKKRCETNNQRAAGVLQPNSEDQRKSAVDSERKRLPAPTWLSDCVMRRSRFRPPLLCGNQRRHDTSQITCVGDMCVEDVQSPSRLTPLIPSFPLKRKHETLQDQNDTPNSKICLTWRPPKCEMPFSEAKKRGEGGICEMKKAKMSTSASGHPVVVVQESKTVALPSHHTDTESGKQSLKPNSKNVASSSKSGKNSLKKTLTDRKYVERVHEELTATEPKIRSKASSCLTVALTSDTRVRDSDKMNPDEKMQMLKKAHEAKVLLLTLVHRDGTTQLDPEQKLTTTVCGLFVLMKSDIQRSAVEDSLGPDDSLMYLKLEQTPAWALQQIHHSQQVFTRDLLHLVLSNSELVVCYKAKDLLRTALQIYKEDLDWKQVAGCHIQDPQVSGWLLDAADPSSCFQNLLHKHFRRQFTTPAVGSQKVSQVISGLNWLLRLHLKLHSDLKNQRLWCLYSNMELKMIPVLAAMESHRIHVDKETLKKTSDFLGTKMKQLEQEAHRAAGQKFLLTSNAQLRTVLFEKLRLHERCENKKLPKTINKQQHSTSEAALLQLQDLHPLPKIILEYRQVHKIKSTFVDGILSCMTSKSYISSTWHQTSAVTGRISAKHPNFQALPRHPLQITRKQFVIGKEDETVTVHPRAMFVPREGWSFVAADFCQIELRLLAHLSSDPELLRIFSTPQADVFTMLASQWKGVAESEVTSEDREHAKRIVYSVVYGAGRERLSGILGVSAEQARQFQDSFLQTYRDVQEFIQRTIQQSHKQGFVLSIMGRRRTLPNINSPAWGIRMQAERQAVNFVVQGSAADLCKMAMIRIFNLISSSGFLSPRLIAQLHDELLYEVEDSQVQEFAALVKGTMESLQHIDHLGVHLKVPLKVAVSCGKSWGSMCDLSLPLTSSSSH